MKAFSTLLFAAATAIVLTYSAQATEESVQLSLWAPNIQLRPAESDIRGLRLDIYGQNHNITGADLGIVGITTGDMNGFSHQWIYDRIDGEAYGVAMSLILHVSGDSCGVEGGCGAFFEKDFTGICGGVYSNVAGAMTGLQMGFVNNCNELHGVQFGLVNMATSGRGLQLGFVNIFDEGIAPVLPFINFHF